MTKIRGPGSGGPRITSPKSDVAKPKADAKVSTGKPAAQLPRSGWSDSSKLQSAIDKARDSVNKFQHPRLKWLPVRPPVGQPTLPPMSPRYGMPAPINPGGIGTLPPNPPMSPRYGMPLPGGPITLPPSPPISPRYGMPLPKPTPGLPSLPPGIFNPPTPPISPRYGMPAPRPTPEYPPISPRYGMPTLLREGITTEPRR